MGFGGILPLDYLGLNKLLMLDVGLRLVGS